MSEVCIALEDTRVRVNRHETNSYETGNGRVAPSRQIVGGNLRGTVEVSKELGFEGMAGKSSRTADFKVAASSPGERQGDPEECSTAVFKITKLIFERTREA
jgi:hypothetical protein